MKSSILAMLVMAPLAAHAADVVVSYTQPITNTDGSAIPSTGAGSINTNRTEWGTCVGTAFGTKLGEKGYPAAASTTVTNLAPGTYCFRAYATNTYGNESIASNVTSKVITAPTPNPPIQTTATIVWEMKPNGTLGKVVGNIAIGTPCIGASPQIPPSLYLVNENDVRLDNTNKPHGTLVAQCGV